METFLAIVFGIAFATFALIYSLPYEKRKEDAVPLMFVSIIIFAVIMIGCLAMGAAWWVIMVLPALVVAIFNSIMSNLSD